MKIIDVKKVSISNGGTQEIKFNNNACGDTVVSEVYIQMPADMTVAATGVVDKDSADVALKLMNVGTYDVVATGSAAGIYMIMAGSLQSLKLTFTGSGNVVIKEVF